jgi:hypothetical protein
MFSTTAGGDFLYFGAPMNAGLTESWLRKTPTDRRGENR